VNVAVKLVGVAALTTTSSVSSSPGAIEPAHAQPHSLLDGPGVIAVAGVRIRVVQQ
jgi:hypothetical protein